MVNYIAVIKSVYDSAKAPATSIVVLAQSIIGIFKALLDIIMILVSIPSTILNAVNSGGTFQIAIPHLDVPGGGGSINISNLFSFDLTKILGAIFAPIVTVINYGIDALNLILGPINQILTAFFNFFNKVLGPFLTLWNKLVDAVQNIINTLDNLAGSLTGFLQYFINNPGTAVYADLLILSSIFYYLFQNTIDRLLPSTALIAAFTLIGAPAALYIYQKYIVKPLLDTNKPDADPAVTAVENTVFGTAYGVQILYPILYLITLPLYYGIIGNQAFSAFSNLPVIEALFLGLNILPVVPVLLYAYFLFVAWRDPATAIKSEVANALGVTQGALGLNVAALQTANSSGNFFSSLSSVKPKDLLGQFVNSLSLTTAQVATLTNNVSLLNLDAFDQIDVLNCLAIDSTIQMITSTANQLILAYVLTFKAWFDLINSEIFSGFISVGQFSLLNVVPLIPIGIWAYYAFYQKEPYDKAVIDTGNFLIFQQNNTAAWYPLFYLIVLSMYYGVISSNAASQFILSSLQGGAALNAIYGLAKLSIVFMPLLPLCVYIYRLLTMNGVNIFADGLLGTFDINAQAASSQAVKDTLSLNLWIGAFYVAAVASWNIFIGDLTILDSLPILYKAILRLAPLIPAGIYFYYIFYAREDANQAVSDTINSTVYYATILTQPSSLSAWYPLIYVGLIGLYYPLITGNLATQFFGLIPIFQPTISRLLFVAPLVPIGYYLYYLITSGNLFVSSFADFVQSTQVNAVNNTISGLQSTMTLYVGIYLLAISAWYELLGSTYVADLVSKLPFFITWVLEFMPLAPLAIVIYVVAQALINPIGALQDQIGTLLNLSASNSALLSRIRALSSISNLLGQSGQNVKIQIVNVLGLNASGSAELSKLNTLNSTTILSPNFYIQLALDGITQALGDKYNWSTIAYFEALMILFTIVTSNSFSVILGVLPGAQVDLIELVFKGLGLIPLGLWVYNAIQIQNFGRPSIVLTVNMIGSVYTFFAANSDILYYALTLFGSLFLGLFTDALHGTGVLHNLLVVLFVLACLPLLIYGYCLSISGATSPLTQARSIVQVFAQLDIAIYLAILFTYYSIYQAPFFTSLIGTFPQWLSILITVGAPIILLIPTILFILFFTQSGDPITALNTIRGVFGFASSTATSFASVISQTSASIGNFSTKSGSNIILSLATQTMQTSTVSQSDRNPNLTQVERFFFGMLYSDQPQNAYYQPDSAVLAKVQLANKINFLQTYTLAQLDNEFGINSGPSYSGYSSQAISRIQYIALPVIVGATNQYEQQVINRILGLLGQPSNTSLSSIPDALLINFARGYDEAGNQVIMTDPSTGQSAAQVSVTTQKTDPQYYQQLEQQGVANREFSASVISALLTQILNTGVPGAVAETNRRMNIYINKFGSLVNTANLRGATDLMQCIYTTSAGQKVAFMNDNLAVQAVLPVTNPNQSELQLWYNDILNQLSYINPNLLTNTSLMYTFFVAGLSTQQFQTIYLNLRSFAVSSLFNSYTNSTQLPFSAIVPTSASSTLPKQVYSICSGIFSGGINGNSRALIKAFSAAAYSGTAINLNQFDSFIMSYYYQASVLLSNVYQAMYGVCGKIYKYVSTNESLDLLSFRRYVGNFSWPTVTATTQAAQLVPVAQIQTALVNAILSALQNAYDYDSTSMSQQNIQAIVSSCLTGTQVNVVEFAQASNVSALIQNIASKLTSNGLALNSTALIKATLIAQLNLNSTDTAALSPTGTSGVNLFSSNTIDLGSNVGTPTAPGPLQTQIADALGWRDPAQIVQRITSLTTATASIATIDVSGTPSIINNLKNYGAAGMLAYIQQNTTVTTITTNTTTATDSAGNNSSSTSNSVITSGVTSSGQINLLYTFVAPASSPGTGSSGISVKSFLGSTLLTPGGAMFGKPAPMGATSTQSVLNTFLKGDAFGGGIGFSDSQILTLNQFINKQFTNLSAVDPQQLYNLILGLITPATSAPPVISLSPGKIIPTASMLFTNIKTMYPGAAASDNAAYFNIFDPQTVVSLNSYLLTALGLTQAQANTLSSSLPSLNQGVIQILSFTNFSSNLLVNAIITALKSYMQTATTLLGQSVNMFSTWYTGLQGTRNNWLAWQKNPQPVTDSVTGRTLQIGYQQGCPKASREQCYQDILNILTNVDGLVGDIENAYVNTSTVSGQALANQLLPQICRMIDYLAVPNQFLYNILNNSDTQYQGLGSQISQYLNGIVDADAQTMSITSLLPSTYEYVHFTMNIPLNLQPLKWTPDTDSTGKIHSVSELSSLINNTIQQNIQNRQYNPDYIARRNEIAYTFLSKLVIDMTWWQQFVLWYYPLPQIPQKNYQSSSTLFDGNYIDQNSVTISKSRDFANRFKYSAASTSLSTNAQGINLKPNPAVWIGNGCLGYGMHKVFTEYVHNFYNVTEQIVANAGLGALQSVFFDSNATPFDSLANSNGFYNTRLLALLQSYRHDVLTGYVFVSSVPLTLNRLDQNYTWINQKKDAPTGLTALQILYMEERNYIGLGGGDEYTKSLQGIIPTVYTSRPDPGDSLTSPTSELFQRSCIENRDFGNYIYYGTTTTVSSGTTPTYTNLNFSKSSSADTSSIRGPTVLPGSTIQVSGAWASPTDLTQTVAQLEGGYYWNSADWLNNRSCLAVPIGLTDTEDSFFAPNSIQSVWQNAQKFLSNPIQFINLNKSYQIYPLYFIQPAATNTVQTESGTSQQVTLSADLAGISWLTPLQIEPSAGVQNGITYSVPYAPPVNTNWTKRYG